MINCIKCEMKFSSNQRLERHYKKAHPIKKGYEQLSGWREPVTFDSD